MNFFNIGRRVKSAPTEKGRKKKARRSFNRAVRKKRSEYRDIVRRKVN